MNSIADFFKFFKCRLFNKYFRKPTENVYEHWDITETNNWIRLLILDDMSLLFFSQPVPKHLIFKKPILKISPPKLTILKDLKDWICALAEQICTVKTYHIGLKWTLKTSIQTCIFSSATIPCLTLPLSSKS